MKIIHQIKTKDNVVFQQCYTSTLELVGTAKEAVSILSNLSAKAIVSLNFDDEPENITRVFIINEGLQFSSLEALYKLHIHNILINRNNADKTIQMGTNSS